MTMAEPDHGPEQGVRTFGDRLRDLEWFQQSITARVAALEDQIAAAPEGGSYEADPIPNPFLDTLRECMSEWQRGRASDSDVLRAGYGPRGDRLAAAAQQLIDTIEGKTAPSSRPVPVETAERAAAPGAADRVCQGCDHPYHRNMFKRQCPVCGCIDCNTDRAPDHALTIAEAAIGDAPDLTVAIAAWNAKPWTPGRHALTQVEEWGDALAEQAQSALARIAALEAELVEERVIVRRFLGAVEDVSESFLTWRESLHPETRRHIDAQLGALDGIVDKLHKDRRRAASGGAT